jgi:hypothetical protein
VAVAAPVVLTGKRRAFLPGVFVFWHLLSLDAPTVAVVWAWAFARTAHVPLSADAAAVLGIGTWLVYVADRLLDSRPGAQRSDRRADLRERHFFHARHRRALLFAAGPAALLLALLILRMPAAARREDAIVFAVAMVYFALVHISPARIRFPRELVVGLVFAAACAVPAWSQIAVVPAGWLFLVPLFAALCWLNCTAIDVWEQPDIDKRRFTLAALGLVIAAVSAALALTAKSALHEPATLRLAGAIFTSALLLFALDRDHRRALRREPGEPSTLAIRILADAALLTPLLFVIPWRI